MSKRRVNREWEEMVEGKASLPPNCIFMMNSDEMKFYFYFPGPEGSPYRNDVISLECSFPSDYPWKPLKVDCHTKIFHPSKLDDHSHICMSLTCGGQWSPAITAKKVIQDFYESLDERILDERIHDDHANDEFHCFQNWKALNLFQNNKPKYDEVVQEHRSKYIENESLHCSEGVMLINALMKQLVDRNNFLLAFYKGELMSEKINNEDIRREVGKFIFSSEEQKEDSRIHTITDPNSETRKISTLRGIADIGFSREFEGRNKEEVLRKYLYFFSGV